jgi:hypothetical protein
MDKCNKDKNTKKYKKGRYILTCIRSDLGKEIYKSLTHFSITF